MKKLLLTLTFWMGACLLVFGQGNPRFTVRVSSDSVLLGDVFKVSFTLENTQGNNFSPPELGAFFDIVAGPNTSSSMSMMNGQVTQTVSYTYYLRPRDIGNFYIEPASIETPEAVLETEPIEVMVVPNPGGERREAPDLRQPAEPFPGFPGFPDFGDMPGMDFWQNAPNDLFRDFPGQDFFKMLPDGFGPSNPDSLFFRMPPQMDFFQMNPDSLFKMLPEEWKQFFPDGFAPQSPARKKKRKTYKI